MIVPQSNVVAAPAVIFMYTGGGGGISCGDYFAAGNFADHLQCNTVVHGEGAKQSVHTCQEKQVLGCRRLTYKEMQCPLTLCHFLWKATGNGSRRH